MNENTPLVEDELAALRALDTPTIANALEPLGLRSWTEGFTRPEIRCIFPETGVTIGYAVTLSMSARREDKGLPRKRYWEHLLSQPAPRSGFS